jgi:hypothetical protein
MLKNMSSSNPAPLAPETKSAALFPIFLSEMIFKLGGEAKNRFLGKQNEWRSEKGPLHLLYVLHLLRTPGLESDQGISQVRHNLIAGPLAFVKLGAKSQRLPKSHRYFPGLDLSGVRRHGVVSPLDKRGQNSRPRVGRDQPHPSFQGLQLPIGGPSSLREDENVLPVFQKSEKTFESHSGGSLVGPRNGDGAQDSYNTPEEKRAKELFFGEVAQTAGKSHAYDQRVQIAAMIAGDNHIPLFRKGFRPLNGEAIIQQQKDLEKHPHHKVKNLIECHRLYLLLP